MNPQDTGQQNQSATQQPQALREKEADLRKLASEGNKEEFFNQVTPLLGPLKSYIKRRLRVAYLTLDIRTPVYTSGDILDRVIFRAYRTFDKKPADLTLEQWLYQLANEILDRYIRHRRSIDKRRRSFETLEEAERRSLEELPISADAEGEVMLLEDLDEGETYQRELKRDFTPPADQDTPEQEVARGEELEQILQALARVPERDRIVFELFAVQGLSKEDVAMITNTPADEVPRIAKNVRNQVLGYLRAGRTAQQTQTENARKAS